MLGTILLSGVSVTAGMLVLNTAILPLLFKYNKTLQRKVVFSNCFNYPRNPNYDDPTTMDIHGARNFNIEFYSKVDDCLIKLGLWHILPLWKLKDLSDSLNDEEDDLLHKELVNTQNPVVLYCHGNANHRASPNRVLLYKVFQKLNYHIVTFDYRGYGDSTQVRPTERGVVEDSFHVYSWLMDALGTKNRPPVILWGHSLGTAVASNLVAHMSELCATQGIKCLPIPDAFILEAPFNNLLEEIEKHPYSKFVSWLPYYRKMFIQPFLASPEYNFATDSYLCSVPGIPLLILHSECDQVVPHKLAVKLYEALAKTRKSPKSAPLVFHSFSRWTGIGHNNICEARELHSIVSAFLQIVERRRKLCDSQE